MGQAWRSVGLVAGSLFLSGCVVDPKALAQALAPLQAKPAAGEKNLVPQQATGSNRVETLSDAAFQSPPAMPPGLTWKDHGVRLKVAWALKAPPERLAGAMAFMAKDQANEDDMEALASLAQVEAEMRMAALAELARPTTREIMGMGYRAWLEKQPPLDWDHRPRDDSPDLEKVTNDGPLSVPAPRPTNFDGPRVDEDRVLNFGGLLVAQRPGTVLGALFMDGDSEQRLPYPVALVCGLPFHTVGAEALQQKGLATGLPQAPALAADDPVFGQVPALGHRHEEHDLVFTQFSSGASFRPETRVERRVRVVDGAFVHRMEGTLGGMRFGYVWKGPGPVQPPSPGDRYVKQVGSGYLEAPSGFVRFSILEDLSKPIPLPGK